MTNRAIITKLTELHGATDAALAACYAGSYNCEDYEQKMNQIMQLRKELVVLIYDQDQSRADKLQKLRKELLDLSYDS